MRCEICESEVEQVDDGWCNICAMFRPSLFGSAGGHPPSSEVRANFEEKYGNSRSRGNRTRWRHLLAQNRLDEDAIWLRIRVEKVPDAPLGPLHHEIDEVEMLAHWRWLKNRLQQVGWDSLESKQLLQRGFPLPDGSWLSCSGEVWSIDGHRLIDVPHRSLLMAFTDSSARIDELAQFDWHTLLELMTATQCPPLDMQAVQGYGREQERARRHLHYINRRQRRRSEPLGAAGQFGGWASTIGRRLGHSTPNHFYSQDMHEQHVINTNFLNHQLGNLSGLHHPWINRWLDASQGGRIWTSHAALKSTRSLRVHRGRLQIRLLREDRWVWLVVPPWPELWATLMSWDISPPTHSGYQELIALRWLWNSPEGGLRPSEAQTRALSMLVGVARTNDRVHICPEGNPVIAIEGTSGLWYGLTMRAGAHSSNFLIRGCLSRREAADDELGEPLCLHPNRSGRRLPLGDQVVSAVLSLSDDLATRHNLAPLCSFISRCRSKIPRGGDEPADRGVVAQQRVMQRLRAAANGDHGGGRWVFLFPRLYEMLIRIPERGVMIIPRVGGILFFGAENFTMTLRSQDERELAISLARATGWALEVEEDGDDERWVRHAVPENNLVRAWIYEVIGPYQRRYGTRADAPWWTHYRIPNVNQGGVIPRAVNRRWDDGAFDVA